MRLPRTLPTAGLAFVVLAAVLLLLAAPADAGASSDDAGFVDVVKVDGLLDPVLTDFVSRSVDQAEASGARWLVLQADSGGAVVSQTDLDALLQSMSTARVPVAIWVGPSGSGLTGESAQLLLVADEIGMAPGTDVGDLAGDPAPLPQERALPADISTRTYSTDEAASAGITTRDAPTIGDFILNLPGVESREVPGEDGQIRREPVTQVRFGQLSLVDQLMHTVASPAVAYLLFAIGLGLMVFELYTAGVGVAGVVGAIAFVLACYGLAVLPARWWAVALLAFSFVAFAIDVQTGVPRFWTGVGVLCFVVASFTLYDGFSLSWLTLAVGIVGVLLAFLAGMPSMVRARFSTPTIGREWMIGEMGRAVTSIDPNGVVQIKEALWRATTNRATPIEELDRVRVTGIEGLVLEVEPEEGGARDYRERRPKGDPPA